MDIPLSSDALDIDFHPSSSSHLIAAGLISGKVQLIDFAIGAGEAGPSTKGHKRVKQRNGPAAHVDDDDEEEQSQEQAQVQREGHAEQALQKDASARAYAKRWSIRPSSKSCRGVAFAPDGDSLYTLSKDGSVFRLSTETGSVVTQWSKAHAAAPSRLLSIEPNLLATGDDDGIVSLWDPRRPSSRNAAVLTYTHHFDWITSMLWCPHLAQRRRAKLTKDEEEKKRAREEKKRKRNKGREKPSDGLHDEEQCNAADRAGPNAGRERLVVTSGDGTLSVIDVRAGRAGVEVSDDQEDELLSIASVKRNAKLVVGTQLGILSLWAPSKGLLDHVDRIPGHPASVDTMCSLDDDTILTGSSDGLVRVVQILPHKLLGIVADHGGMPVERLTRRDNWLASIGHGPEIKMTDLGPLLDDGDNDEDEDDGEGEVDFRPQGLLHLAHRGAAEEDSSSGDKSDDANDGAVEEGDDKLDPYNKIFEEESESGSEVSDDEDHPVSTSKGRTRQEDFLRPSMQTQQEAGNHDFFADL